MLTPVVFGNEAAEPVSDDDVSEDIGIVRKATIYVDDAQQEASERLGNFMSQVDGFFSDPEGDGNPIENKSWARVRLDAKRPGGGDVKVKPSLKLRAALPNTERKLKLLISTEDEDTAVVGDNIEQTLSTTSSSDQNASVAIRFIRSARTNGSVNIDLGVRQRDDKVQYFSRLNTGYKTKVWTKWDASISNSYYYYSRSGFEDRLSFDLRREFFGKEHFFFRSGTEFNWRKGQKGSIVGQSFGIYTQFGPTRFLALEMLAGYHTALNDDITDRFRGHEYRVRWRHNVWRPWFFYEVWPSVSWPSTNGYKKSYGALLRLEVVIGQR